MQAADVDVDDVDGPYLHDRVVSARHDDGGVVAGETVPAIEVEYTVGHVAVDVNDDVEALE